MAYDLIGNIAIIQAEGKSKKEKLEKADNLLKIPNVRSVFEKVGSVHGRLRTIKLKYLKGEKNLIADYKENNCRFKLDVSSCYFSSRLSGERKFIASKIRKNDKVLVMFAGVGVYPIIIYKNSNDGKPAKIVGVEIGKDCCKWFKENLNLNNISENQIEVVQGDVKKRINNEFVKKFGKFDVVIMARPNLKESFLNWGLKSLRKGGILFYYGFCNVDEIDNLIKNLIKEAKDLGRKIKLIEKTRTGDIAPYKFRYRIEFKVME